MNKKENMKKIFFVLPLIIMLAFLASAQTTVHYFYGDGCPHCANVAASGILDKVINENVSVIKYQIYGNTENTSIFYSFTDRLGISKYNRGVPFAAIQCNGNLSYLMGDSEIIDNLEQAVQTCESMEIKPEDGTSPSDPSQQDVTIVSIILGALVDSINPCAFGVLIFLLISLMSIGSRKRMLKAAFLYTAAVYVTYFFAGLGIFRIIQSLTRITQVIYFASGILVLLAGIIEIKDFFWYGKGFTLRISPRFRPIIENIANKGTMPAVILLGFLVSLFELPCTGGIYLAILTMMSINKSFAISYLLLYNLIFVLPLLVITYVIYKGTSPGKIEKWREKERKWMKLAAGIVLVALGMYILIF